MGSIIQTVTHDREAFPAALFAQEGNVPIAQCQETKNIQVGCTSNATEYIIEDINDDWDQYDLVGKEVVVAGTAVDNGTFAITANELHKLTTDHQFTNNEAAIVATVQDVGQAYLTRNTKSFAAFIHAAGYAYTIKGGKLHTDCPDPTLTDACSDTWSPGE